MLLHLLQIQTPWLNDLLKKNKKLAEVAMQVKDQVQHQATARVG